MVNFTLKVLYLIAYPVLKLFKPELTTYDVKDVDVDSVPTDAISNIVTIGFSAISMVLLLFYIAVTMIYKAPQAVYDLKSDIIKSNEASPLVQDEQFVDDTNKVLTPKSNDVQYLEKKKIDDPQDEVDALKEKLHKQKEKGQS